VPDTIYAVRRVALTSALRVGLAVGPAVALGPAVLLAALLWQALDRFNRLLGGITPLELRFLGQDVARLDWLALLGLQDAAQATARLAAPGWLTFLGLTLALTLVGGLLVALALLLGAAAYNAAGGLTGGLALELRPHRRGLPEPGPGAGSGAVAAPAAPPTILP
jgi:hypothetical protein